MALLRKNINIDTFNSKLEFIISEDIYKDIKRIYKSYDSDVVNYQEVEGIFISSNGSKYHLVIDKEYLSHNTIAHEVYHSVIRITEDKDVKDEETRAWLCGYITENIYKFIKLKKLEIK